MYKYLQNKFSTICKLPYLLVRCQSQSTDTPYQLLVESVAKNLNIYQIFKFRSLLYPPHLLSFNKVQSSWIKFCMQAIYEPLHSKFCY